MCRKTAKLIWNAIAETAGKEVLEHSKKDWQLRDWLLQVGQKRQKEMQLKMCKDSENAAFYPGKKKKGKSKNATFYIKTADLYRFTSSCTDVFIGIFQFEEEFLAYVDYDPRCFFVIEEYICCLLFPYCRYLFIIFSQY